MIACSRAKTCGSAATFWRSVASASSARAAATSISSKASASSTNTVTRSGSACMKPSLVASSKRRAAPFSRTFARSTPGLSALRNGAWCARMPSSPSVVTAITSSAWPSKTTFVGVMSLNGIADMSDRCAEFLGRGFDVVDAAGVEEGLLRNVIDFAVEDLFERRDRVRELDVLAGSPGELLRDEKRQREHALHAARARDRNLVVFRKLLDPQDRDYVLQVFVTLQGLLNAARDLVVLLADDLRIENPRARRQRIHGGIDAEFGNRTRERRRRVQVRERHRDGRVGIVVRRHVHRLHRGDRALVRGGDPLLKRTHVRRKRRLITHGRRHASHERRYFRTGLQIAEDVVDEQQHVGADFIAEVFGHRDAG